MSFVRLCFLIIMLFMHSAPVKAQISSIGVAGDGNFTRFTLTADEAFTPALRIVESERGPQITLLMPSIEVAEGAFFGQPTGGVLAYTLDTDRIILELDRPMLAMREMSLPPVGSEPKHRYVLDLTSVSAARFTSAAEKNAAAMPQPAERTSVGDLGDALAELNIATTLPTPNPIPAAAQEKRSMFGAVMNLAQQERYRIVIDPGHGGRDPGALSIIGGKESDIVLKTALTLQQRLQADPRYFVYLTRETDVYVEHEDRVSRARDWGADLFISLHADAAGAPTVAGASVYTISTRGEARIEGVSKKYGWELPFEDGTNDDVSDILQALTLRETKSNSAIFAELLVPELGRAGPLLRNTHRRKNLFVLLAPDVPAVLVEIGFLTNRDDAKRLRTVSGREKSAEAIYRAINAYFDRKDILLAEK